MKAKTKIAVTRRTLLADLQTPVGIYLKVRDLYPQSTLLESSITTRPRTVFRTSASNPPDVY